MNMFVPRVTKNDAAAATARSHVPGALCFYSRADISRALPSIRSGYGKMLGHWFENHSSLTGFDLEFAVDFSHCFLLMFHWLKTCDSVSCVPERHFLAAVLHDCIRSGELAHALNMLSESEESECSKSRDCDTFPRMVSPLLASRLVQNGSFAHMAHNGTGHTGRFPVAESPAESGGVSAIAPVESGGSSYDRIGAASAGSR
jgi:hypothetical protein